MTTSGLLAALLAGSLFSFNVGPDVDVLKTQTPPALVATVSQDALSPESAWWSLFEDPLLNICVDQAFRRNSNLDMALARVEQARAVLGETRSYQSPTLDAQATTSRGRVVGPQGGATSRTEQDANRVVGSVNYEADLFGRLKKGTAAARADWLATQAARDSVRLVLAADVARTYFNLRGTDNQLRIARETLSADIQSLVLLEQRYRLGKDSELNYQRFRAQTASVAVQVRQFEQQLALYESALLVLLGYDPAGMVTVMERYRSQDISAVSLDHAPSLPDVPVGLPTQVLERRPDILQAKLQYMAAVSRIGQAKAARFPSLSFNGLLGSASGPLSDLFSGPTGWSLAGQLVAPVLDAGRRKSQMQQAEARAWEARANYEQTARTAFQEILDALMSRGNLEEQGKELAVKEMAQARAYTLVSDLYSWGRIGQLDVLDAQRLLLQAQLDRAGNWTGQLNNAVDLCLALGGGWNVIVSDDLQTKPVKKRYLQDK